jgi:hypothetical protein
MSDLLGALEAFSVEEITKANLPLPVKVELMDISMVAFVEMVAVGPSELGLWSFEKKCLPGTLWKQAPHRVRFTGKDKSSVMVDFPWPIRNE